jgi:2-C-methyl-D-erythritol 4-phosphate cytidylyltransferase
MGVQGDFKIQNVNSTDSERMFALVPCAGVGARAGSELPKQYVSVAGKPMVEHSLRALQAVDRLHSIVVVLAPDDTLFPAKLAELPRTQVCYQGGATRADTVRKGLQVLQQMGCQPHDWVLVHDAARCLVRPEWINRLIDACQADAVGGLLAMPLADTLKSADSALSALSRDAPLSRVAVTLHREGKWAAQTPQMFRWGMLYQALEQAAGHNQIMTDESSAIEALGYCPILVLGASENFKVTYPDDFDMAEVLLSRRVSKMAAHLENSLKCVLKS